MSKKTVDPTQPAAQKDIRVFLDALNAGGGKPMEQMKPKEARKVLEGAQSSVEVPLYEVEISEKTIHVEGQDVLLHLVRPARVKEALPVFMFFHGGGWVLGDFPTHERLVRDLVHSSGAAAVFVNYTPSPEAHYPTAINQAYAATEWVAEYGEKINVDGSRLAVVGNSVGGNMAAAVSLMAKEKGTPALRSQILLWPVTHASFDTDSYHQYAEGHFLTRNMMKWFWDNYTTDKALRKEIYASPLNASLEQLKGLPPALVQTAELDVLRDEGEAYARLLNAAGVEVTSTRYNGLIHDYGLLNPIAHVPAVHSAIHQAGRALKHYLA
ncbi:alpha/beta hydrolase domain-containing protein [Serratia sp. AS12]|uniref:alpha/beta hydrolase n=1 Tax=Serratia TaxID=613 RepID=UPI00020E9BEA|nr:MULTISPECIES: alpha/beta hydrolase [Serratia]AEF46061.1 alpha/beta hydrolase domain-containing protein [Serratia plymuthica AS9]AEF51012.1 alpha/beta hydrolase domain-containing protein [Serratia sp. AS12]AEG28719.1 alpha/beta hydrolase domain-containing protein [Serratia sp. AS13]UTN94807.1 alpha/beta hydrolase [Serratia plymuthica]